MSSTEKLSRYLLKQFPALKKYYQKYNEVWEGEPHSEYAVFAWIVKPFINDLLEARNENDLMEIWGVLEKISKEWGDPARNEIFVVTTEEIDLHKHYRYLGDTLKEQWLTSITWYPTFNHKASPINRHIDPSCYRSRWLEEIEKIGGFENLGSKSESDIYKQLRSEFDIRSDVST